MTFPCLLSHLRLTISPTLCPVTAFLLPAANTGFSSTERQAGHTSQQSALALPVQVRPASTDLSLSALDIVISIIPLAPPSLYQLPVSSSGTGPCVHWRMALLQFPVADSLFNLEPCLGHNFGCLCAHQF